MTDTFRTRCVVFAEHPALPSVAEYGDRHGWRIVSETPPGVPRNAPREIVFSTGQADAAVHLCEDDITQNSYAFAVGGSKDGAEALIGVLERALPSWSVARLLTEVDRGAGFDEKGRALIRLAIAAPKEFDPAVFERVRDCLIHPDERLRALAIWATSYTPWPEYRRLLANVAAEDASKQIRDRAARMFASFDAEGPF